MIDINKKFNHFEVIIVGAGHAGCEAASAAARMGAKTLLITQNLDTIGHMSCNPSIGGLGKSHLVKEIDAMGGLMALITDKSGIQFRLLNQSKGPAVRAIRAQADRTLYKSNMREALENTPNLEIFQQAVEDLIISADKVVGIKTQIGLDFYANAVVLTSGTFLDGKIHIGMVNFAGGRAGDAPATALAHRLREMPLKVGRLKTGTPPRLDGRSIDYSQMTAQEADDPLPVFSLRGNREMHPPQVVCHITNTNEKTNEIIRNNLSRSPLYGGVIDSTGPRYCPSIEDKVVKFAERNQHQIFLEPEGLQTYEVYPNGISTSLPFDVQLAVIASIKGLENARIIRMGYAIEYDYFDPRDLKPSLETRVINGLFFAGQINGTTGYEEAAAQGLIAGINAVLLSRNEKPFIVSRFNSYMGVMVDDLIHRGIIEPYRMFTSRAEYRLFLRSDNADLRLSENAYKLGLIGDQQWREFNQKLDYLEKSKKWLNEQKINQQQLDSIKNKMINYSEINWELNQQSNFVTLLKRPEVNINTLQKISKLLDFADIPDSENDEAYKETLENEIKYAGYVNRQIEEAKKHNEYEKIKIPENIDYQKIPNLSNELRFKLNKYRPNTLGEARAISGVTPAGIAILQVYLKKIN